MSYISMHKRVERYVWKKRRGGSWRRYKREAEGKARSKKEAYILGEVEKKDLGKEMALYLMKYFAS